jgi:hypothetical protein
VSELQALARAAGGDAASEAGDGRGVEQRVITMKYNFDFLDLPLVAALFPRATIIHCTRSAPGVVYSMYATNFVDPALQWQFADLHRLGEYYGGYHELMKQWVPLLQTMGMVSAAIIRR